MARPFGGRFSPGSRSGPPADPAQEERRAVHAAGGRANMMFLPALVAASFSLFGPPGELVLGLAGAAALASGAWLLREGLKAEAAFAARATARRPALPRKALAALLCAAGAALCALAADRDAEEALLYALAAAALHLAAFGLDPWRDKLAPGADPFQQGRAARVAEEAEAHLASLRDALAPLRDRALDARVAAFEAVARRMIRTVEDDPRDLVAARTYLSVYLQGARDAAARFAEVQRRAPDADARADFQALLADLEGTFAARTDRLLEGGREALDVEITVLRDRLRREGVTPGQGG